MKFKISQIQEKINVNGRLTLVMYVRVRCSRLFKIINDETIIIVPF